MNSQIEQGKRALRRHGPIYPFPVKPRTAINRWSQWPEDCVDAIRDMVRGWYRPGGSVFKCDDCSAYCEAHPYGVPHIKETNDVLCDDCLIARARNERSAL